MHRITKPLPENAHCVFKGKIFEVWQWEQELFDGSTMTFERLKRADTVVILATVGDKIIIQHQEQPDSSEFIDLPSGRVDEGEKPLAAAARELLEETGYVSHDWEKLSEEMPYGKIEWTIHSYVARDCIVKSEQHLDAGEKIRVAFVTFEDFLLLADDPKFRSTNVRELLWQARLYPEKKDALHATLFGK